MKARRLPLKPDGSLRSAAQTRERVQYETTARYCAGAASPLQPAVSDALMPCNE